MGKFDFFWNTMKLCDWSTEGDCDDDKVLKPIVDLLANSEDEKIFEFQSLMTELLYDLDTKKLYNNNPMSFDGFLYSRCVALINGEDYYKKVKAGRIKKLWTMELEFESLLYVSKTAWSIKHKSDSFLYPYIGKLSYETGSNKAKWE